MNGPWVQYCSPAIFALVAALPRFKQKLKAITKKTIPASFDERITRLNQLARGWINYFKLASIQQKLKKLDEMEQSGIHEYCKKNRQTNE